MQRELCSAVRRCASRALSPLPLTFSHKFKKSLCGAGPSLSVFQPRLDSSWSRSSARFARAYHERILGVVLTACLGGAIVFRFIIIQPLVELICWLGLGVLEIVPRLTAISTMSSQDHSAIFKSSWWAYIVTGYELFVFNPLYPLRTIYQCTHRNSRLGLTGNSH